MWFLMMVVIGAAGFFLEWRFLLIATAILLLARVSHWYDEELLQSLPILLDLRTNLRGDE